MNRRDVIVVVVVAAQTEHLVLGAGDASELDDLRGPGVRALHIETLATDMQGLNGSGVRSSRRAVGSEGADYGRCGQPAVAPNIRIRFALPMP
jgi:hypothetical protein